MHIRTYYRTVLWLPLLLPAVVGMGKWLFGTPVNSLVDGIVTILLVSGAFGAIPYSLLAFWATWRIGKLDEQEIRRLALLAPIYMIIAFAPFAFLVSRDLGALLVWGVGAAYILVLGYAYVGMVFLLRRLIFGMQPTSPDAERSL